MTSCFDFVSLFPLGIAKGAELAMFWLLKEGRKLAEVL
jgi:hypothetical protein